MCFGRSIGHKYSSPRLAGIVNPPPTMFSPHQPHALVIQLLAIDPYRTMASSLWPAPNLPRLRPSAAAFLALYGTWIAGHLGPVSAASYGHLVSHILQPLLLSRSLLHIGCSYRTSGFFFSICWYLLSVSSLYAFDSDTENLTVISRLSSESLYMYSCSSESTSQKEKKITVYQLVLRLPSASFSPESRPTDKSQDTVLI